MSFSMHRYFEKKNPFVSELVKKVEKMHDEYFELYPGYEMPAIYGVPSAHEFLKLYVSQNRPVLMKNAAAHYPAYTKWTDEYLKSKLKNEIITVGVTPNGYADAIYNNDFLMAEEIEMTFDEFLEKLENPQKPVYYIQKQDNNFCTEFKNLLPDLDDCVPWASEALEDQPDAVNFWMGDGRAVTSLHKDHYENIYYVLRGKKDFILHAPIDAPWIPYKKCESGRFRKVTAVNEPMVIELVNKKTKWIPVDPLDREQQEKFPLYSRVRKIYCTVEAGDGLYIPSLWYHHVRQSHGCIAVNYWYDMDFNHNYCQFKFLENVGKLIHAELDVKK